MKSIQELFPLGSGSFFKANPLSSPSDGVKNEATGRLRARRGRMNKTEAEYSLILEAERQMGEILRWEFEGMTLRWPVGDEMISYTPDFYVLCDQAIHPAASQVKFIEVKGRYIKGKFERAIERFRHARTYWPEFQFEMHQKTKEGWKQIL